MASSINDLKSPYFWRGVVAEVLGTMFLVLIGCGSCLGKDWASNPPTQVQISLCFGLGVATIVWSIGHISGGHINPAVTMGMLFACKISVVRAIIFIISQCLGAILGAAVLKVMTPDGHSGTLGMTTVDAKLTDPQGCGVEFVITALLVFTVFASCDSFRTDLNGSAPLAIGFCVTVCHLFAIKYTGSSMNPARTFGPAVITGMWEDHWVYWVGPLSGGIVAALFYELFFASDASIRKTKNFFSCNNTDNTRSKTADDPEKQPK